MESNQTETGSFNEEQSLRVIREMIEASHKRIKNDGILFIVWGWIGFITGFVHYLTGTIPHTYMTGRIIKWFTMTLPIAGLLFTVYYLYTKSRKATTYIGISLRYVWVSLFVVMILINLIQFNVMHKIIFDMQHALFMVVTAFAIVITGGILRYKMIVAGGILFAAMAYLSSYFTLNEQLLVESIAWFIAFVIPGHALFSRRNK